MIFALSLFNNYGATSAKFNK